MRPFLKGCLAGTYIIGAVVTFLLIGFLVLLGGNSAELWKPFVYAIAWPLFWTWFAYELLC